MTTYFRMTVVWLSRDRLVQAQAIDKLFARVDAALSDGWAWRQSNGIAAPL